MYINKEPFIHTVNKRKYCLIYLSINFVGTFDISYIDIIYYGLETCKLTNKKKNWI